MHGFRWDWADPTFDESLFRINRLVEIQHNREVEAQGLCGGGFRGLRHSKHS